MKMTIGDFLLARLAQLHIDQVLGVPGDFNLQFLDQIKHSDALSFVGCCNELNAAYAADGYARLNGASALLTTYGVGDLSAICGVAGAAAEHLPMVCISGAPPLHMMRKNQPLHHTLGDGDYDNVMNCFAQFCTQVTRLTPDNAVTEVDRVLATCMRENKPVYIQLPSDVSHITVEVPETCFEWQQGSNPERLQAALDAMVALWQSAERRAILVDMDAERQGYEQQLLTLAEATATHYAALSTGKALLPENHPLSLGIYKGAQSDERCRATVEQADCLITTSPRFMEVNSGHFSVRLPQQGVVALSHDSVTIDGTPYYAVKPRELMARFVDAVQQAQPAPPARLHEQPDASAMTVRDDAPLTQARLWPRLARFVAPGDVVIAEAGTSGIGLGSQQLPNDISYITSQFWGAIGSTLPTLLGSCLAAPQRRQLLFIGDGSFQLTAQELSTLMALEHKPVIFLLNNKGYTIERYIHGLEDAYNDVRDWDYSGLPAVLGGADRHVSVTVDNEAQLEHALDVAQTSDKLVFIELHLDALDAPAGMAAFGAATAEFDYGPLGPQRRGQAGDAPASSESHEDRAQQPARADA